MQILDSPILTLGLLFGQSEKGRLSSFLMRGGVREYLSYAYGRIALLDGLKILDCEKDNNVLLPSYICDVAVEPFYELGIPVRFYKVLNNLQPDIADIRGKIDRKTKAILVVNYFGFPQRLAEIQRICQEYGIALIEDNAHGFLSRKESRLLGTFGDIGFSSVWKVLPIPNGAFLFLNSDELIKRAQNLPQIGASQDDFTDASVYKYLLGSLLNYLEIRFKFPSEYVRYLYRKFSSEGERNSYREYQKAKVRISRLSLEVMKRVDPEDIVKKRRENYQFWLDKLYGKSGLTVIFGDLSEGVCPQVFPVVADEADGFEEKLLKRGIYVYRWPYLSKEVKDNSEYPMANFLSKHLLALPVHQSTHPNHLEKVTKGVVFP